MTNTQRKLAEFDAFIENDLERQLEWLERNGNRRQQLCGLALLIAAFIRKATKRN